MKKITITLLSLIASASFAQTIILDFETGGENVDFGPFAFGGAAEEIVADGANSTASASGITVPQTTDTSFPGVTYPKNSNEADGLFLQLYVKADINTNFFINLEDDSNTGAPDFVPTPRYDPLSANGEYTGAGDYQLVEVALAVNDITEFGTNIEEGFEGIYPRFTILPGSGVAQPAYDFLIDEISLNTISLSTGDFTKDEVSVYPIPATLAVNIRGNISGNTVTIYDISGSMVGTSAITGDFNSVDVSTLAKGVYFMQLENGSVLKFVK